jgi:hypothetical protein
VTGLAALAVRMGGLPAGFAERFPQRAAYCVGNDSLDRMGSGDARGMAQGASWYGPEAGGFVVSEYLDRRVQALASDCPSLRVLLEAARAIGDRAHQPDLRNAAESPGMRLLCRAAIQRRKLHEFSTCCATTLTGSGQVDSRRNWPTQAARARPYLCPANHGFHDSVINLPILLALTCNTTMDLSMLIGATTQTSSGIREVQSFDPEWFAEAFDLTVARCLATGRIDLPQPDVPHLPPDDWIG